jgi:hydroxymethylglutaryl-CoA lyase
VTLPSTVEIIEVAARDGLQNEAVELSTADKVALIRRADAAGASRIEIASFVHPTRVPRMADAEAVCTAVGPLRAVSVGLALNRRGVERALKTQVDEIGAVAAASDGFAQSNQGRDAEGTIQDALEIIALTIAAGRRAQATISVAFGCPFDGEVPAMRVAEIARRLADGGAREVALADTIGAATPTDVRRVVATIVAAVPGFPLRLHAHDTRNTAVANAWAAMEGGVAILDSSIGGLGGCPFAPGASGNVATEDLLYTLDRGGITTGLSLTGVVEAAQWLGERLGRPLPGRVSRVGAFPPARD